MLKQSMKTLVVKTCAFACILGLSANTFVVAAKSIAVERNESVIVAPAAPTAEPSPEPSPLPVRPGVSPAVQNQMQQPEQGRRYGSPGFVGEPINLNVVNADIRDILNYIT